MGLEQLQATLGQYYNVAYEGAASQIRHEGRELERAALESYGARGTSASGSAERAISENIRGGVLRSLAGVKGQLAGQQAGQLGGLYGDKLNRDFQEKMIRLQRQWQTDDALRDTLMNLGTTALAGPLTGLSSGLSYNITSALAGPSGANAIFGTAKKT